MSELVRGPLHADLEALAFLVGTWLGTGRGEYPTIEPFDYEEELTFGHVGDTFLLYEQRSWSPEEGAPIHFERGFMRPGEDGRVEFTLAHPLGLTEVSEGVLDGTSFELTSKDVGRTTTGMDVIGLVRRYRVDGDDMTYVTDMATERTPMAVHLEGSLRRVKA